MNKYIALHKYIKTIFGLRNKQTNSEVSAIRIFFKKRVGFIGDFKNGIIFNF
ncbi:hypothetical protein ETSB_0896 [cyanobacterium endosymbiont of Epithemia turgida isolate EtSB Lake Yunoko]|nr:hypothetical protein ETSB_0896 [cyanobacterium endosymbiont of Epithemia turgida isolate EtSB Lake Yunoko]